MKKKRKLLLSPISNRRLKIFEERFLSNQHLQCKEPTQSPSNHVISYTAGKQLGGLSIKRISFTLI